MPTKTSVLTMLLLAGASLSSAKLPSHAEIDPDSAVDEPDCGLTRLPLRRPRSCFRGDQMEPPPHNYRIAHGVSAPDQEHPWMAAIVYFGDTICGGVIVSRRCVLTAAHCLEGKSVYLLNVQVGSVVADHRRRYDIDDYFLADNYDEATNHDFGLVKTSEDIDFVVDDVRDAYAVNAICLPKRGIRNGKFRDEFGVVTGFGRLAADTPESASILQKSAGLVPRRLDCFQDEDQLCFISRDSEVCLGDSGSPLVQFDGDRAVVLGLVKRGYEPFPAHRSQDNCGPHVILTRVSYFLPLIEKHCSRA